MNIILTGYMGCGKTEIGARLSKKLGMKSIDLDQYIEEKEGFSEKRKGNFFFRKGKIGSWKQELSIDLVKIIEKIVTK